METNRDNLIGTILKGKYRIDELLAEGGQGKIYYATDLSAGIDRQYIVKQFTPNYDNDFLLNVGTRFFNQESEILQKLGRHSQIPQIFDHFEADKKFYLVQEFIEGNNLETEFASKKQLTEMELFPILKDILDVLNFVHQNNYIHRDIKPSNLIRNKYDQKIYLIDFGAVKEKIKRENIGNQGESKSTVVIGTEGYMPNEQKLSRPKFCSDIYAAGMVAINALTGVDPQQIFKDEKFNPIWQHHLPADSKKYNPNLLRIIDKMVRGSCQERYQSVTEILGDWQKLNDTIVIKSPMEDISPTLKNSENNTAEENNKKSWLTWLVWGIGTIVGTIVLGIAGFSLIPQEKYIAYENKEHKIKIERPESWQVREDWNTFQEKGVKFLTPLENNQDEYQERVAVSIEELSTPLSLAEYNAQATNQIATYNTIIEPATPTTFANKEGTKIIYQEKEGNKKRLEYWTVKNQKAYIATYSAEVDKFDKYLKKAEETIASLMINDVTE
ncbi:serine/threonine protein kinase [Waterburya agarophytonicola K14]|uniref:non-specific serine/threonine protein kinase n=1 Tax=Waterburya agarophytonicola KI4 TaxID=2874699 RepID=A0A964BW75_9CYAN|nr:serine/threonine-protein kinase [Waterburya agarophytonicola]MCC0178730.1 serine/threonine protein kinase [Waterburya agarophytonicola KI4]